MKNRPKIAVIRGSSLNSWEMQNYSPLQEDFDIFAISSQYSHYDTESISFPVKRCATFSDLSARLTLNRTGMIRRVPFLKRLNSDRFIGLDKTLQDVDLVHTVGLFQPFNQQITQLRKKHRYKIVSTIWENIPFLWNGVGVNSQKTHHRKQQSIETFDHFLAISQRARAALILEGADENKITVQPMGIDTDRFTPQAKNPTILSIQPMISADDVVVLSVANLTGDKGERELIFAAGLLQKKGFAAKQRLRFIIVGQGCYHDTLRNLIDRVGVYDIVHLIPQVPYHDMPQVHNLADVFCLGSRPTEIWMEQFGMVLIESMACGKPIIAADSGSISEVVGDVGILLPSGDYFRLAQELENLIPDADKRATLGIKARQRALDHFSSQKAAQAIAQIYHQLLG